MSTVTLQNLCLKVIVSNFKRYCELYRSTEDSCLKFEFLKKKCSVLILQKLMDERRLKAKYLDFLINEYLKVLDTRWLRAWSWEGICQRLAEIGASLEEVTFFRFDMPWDEVLCYLPNLKSVTFKYFCDDKFLLSLSQFCKSVEILDINNSKDVSDNGIMHLCCKDNDKKAPIKELVVGNSVGDEDIVNALRYMPFLEKIDYYSLPNVLYSMHESTFNAFDKVKPVNLTYLELNCDIDKPIFTNVLTVCVSLCPHLKSLSCPIYQKHHLDLCSQLHELEELKLYYFEEDPLELNELLTLKGKKLTSLYIYNFCVSLSILAQNCPKLLSLELDNIILQYNCNDSVPVFHNLEKVVVFCRINPEAVSCLLSSAPNLKQLYFNECDLCSSDIKIQILRCCEQCDLNVIAINFSDVEFELVRDILLTCSTLQTLNVYDYFDLDVRNKLRTLSTSLPNKPQICIEIPICPEDDEYNEYNFPNPYDSMIISD